MDNQSSSPMRPGHDRAGNLGRLYGQVAQEAVARGIPPWVDWRRATAASPEQGAFADPRTQQILSADIVGLILAQASLARGGRVIELGCGAGWLSLELARHGLHVEGVDLSAEQIEIAQAFAQANPFTEGFGSLRYRVADLNALALAREAYDVVVAHCSLYHVQELERLFREVEKALRPQGRLLIVDGMAGDWRNRLLMGFFYLLLPSDLRLRQRGRKLLARLLRGERVFMSREALASWLPGETGPEVLFTGVQGEQIVTLARRHFAVEQIHSSLAFAFPFGGLHLGRGHGWAYRQRYKLLQALRWLDDLLIRMHLVRGMMVFISARKRR